MTDKEPEVLFFSLFLRPMPINHGKNRIVGEPFDCPGLLSANPLDEIQIGGHIKARKLLLLKEGILIAFV